MQHADRSVVLAKITGLIAETRLSMGHAEQGTNRGGLAEDNRRAHEVFRQRREELALLLAVYDFALTAQPNAEQIAASLAPEETKPRWLYGSERPAFTAPVQKGPPLPQRVPGAQPAEPQPLVSALPDKEMPPAGLPIDWKAIQASALEDQASRRAVRRLAENAGLVKPQD